MPTLIMPERKNTTGLCDGNITRTLHAATLICCLAIGGAVARDGMHRPIRNGGMHMLKRSSMQVTQLSPERHSLALGLNLAFTSGSHFRARHSKTESLAMRCVLPRHESKALRHEGLGRGYRIHCLYHLRLHLDAKTIPPASNPRRRCLTQSATGRGASEVPRVRTRSSPQGHTARSSSATRSQTLRCSWTLGGCCSRQRGMRHCASPTYQLRPPGQSWSPLGSPHFVASCSGIRTSPARRQGACSLLARPWDSSRANRLPSASRHLDAWFARGVPSARELGWRRMSWSSNSCRC